MADNLLAFKSQFLTDPVSCFLAESEFLQINAVVQDLIRMFFEQILSGIVAAGKIQSGCPEHHWTEYYLLDIAYDSVFQGADIINLRGMTVQDHLHTALLRDQHVQRKSVSCQIDMIDVVLSFFKQFFEILFVALQLPGRTFDMNDL